MRRHEANGAGPFPGVQTPAMADIQLTARPKPTPRRSVRAAAPGTFALYWFDSMPKGSSRSLQFTRLALSLYHYQAFRFEVLEKLDDLGLTDRIVNLVFARQTPTYLRDCRGWFDKLEDAQSHPVEAVADATRGTKGHGLTVDLRENQIRTPLEPIAASHNDVPVNSGSTAVIGSVPIPKPNPGPGKPGRRAQRMGMWSVELSGSNESTSTTPGQRVRN